MFLEKQILGRGHGIGDFMVMQDGLAAGDAPDIVAAVGLDKIEVEGFGRLLGDAGGK